MQNWFNMKINSCNILVKYKVRVEYNHVNEYRNSFWQNPILFHDKNTQQQQQKNQKQNTQQTKGTRELPHPGKKHLQKKSN